MNLLAKLFAPARKSAPPSPETAEDFDAIAGEIELSGFTWQEFAQTAELAMSRAEAEKIYACHMALAAALRRFAELKRLNRVE